jgi:hypothetical protein
MTAFRRLVLAVGLLPAALALLALGPASAGRIDEAQKILTKLGYYGGTIDGKWGDETRQALNAFQQKAGFNQTKTLNADFMDVLRTIDAGATRNFAPIQERIGNTLLVASGERIYFDPDGTKIIQVKGGLRYKRSWRKMSNGLHCETLYDRREFCEGVSKSKYVIYRLNDETRWFRLNGHREWTMQLKPGKQLKP